MCKNSSENRWEYSYLGDFCVFFLPAESLICTLQSFHMLLWCFVLQCQEQESWLYYNSAIIVVFQLDKKEKSVVNNLEMKMGREQAIHSYMAVITVVSSKAID